MMLSQFQKLGSVAVGVTLWLVFIFVVRWIPWAFDGSWRSALLFMLSIPLTYGFVVFLKKAVSLDAHSIFQATALATMPALLLDGLVFTFISSWYGATEAHVRHGAGFILWGAGVGMLMAWFMNTSKEVTR